MPVEASQVRNLIPHEARPDQRPRLLPLLAVACKDGVRAERHQQGVATGALDRPVGELGRMDGLDVLGLGGQEDELAQGVDPEAVSGLGVGIAEVLDEGVGLHGAHHAAQPVGAEERVAVREDGDRAALVAAHARLVLVGAVEAEGRDDGQRGDPGVEDGGEGGKMLAMVVGLVGLDG
jgi:hypothetical protein